MKDTIGDSMRAIANLLMTDDLALCYSWTGHKGKKPIKENTHLFSAIASECRTILYYVSYKLFAASLFQTGTKENSELPRNS